MLHNQRVEWNFCSAHSVTPELLRRRVPILCMGDGLTIHGEYGCSMDSDPIALCPSLQSVPWSVIKTHADSGNVPAVWGPLSADRNDIVRRPLVASTANGN